MKKYKKDTLWVEVTSQHHHYTDIACSFFTPKSGNAPVLVDLYFNLDQYLELRNDDKWEIQIRGKQTGNYWPLCEIRAETMYPRKLENIVRGEEVREYRVRFEAWDLQVIRFIGPSQPQKPVSSFQFLLTPPIDNLALGPVYMPDISKGHIENKLTNTLTLEIRSPSGEVFILSDNDTIKLETDQLSITDGDELLEQVEDILTVVSFAHRKLVRCFRWSCLDDAGTATETFRKVYAVPGDNTKKRTSNPIFFYEPEIVRKAAERFMHNPHREFVSRAIYLSIPDRHLDIDTQFIKLFTIVEVLAKRCRTNPSRKELHKQAKDYFDKFEVRLEDLWPMFTLAKKDPDADGPSLYDIRNHLTHGRMIRTADYPGLIVAGQHLRMSVERMIACALGMDINRSDMGPQQVDGLLEQQDWQSTRRKMLSF